MENVSCCVKCHHRVIMETLLTTANNQFTIALVMTLNQLRSLNQNSEKYNFLLEQKRQQENHKRKFSRNMKRMLIFCL